ncbi:MAG: F0F1 ATP synthase subunit A [Fimbriimonadaceae bacterium]|nr:F0F1 ATP synthase subunit A [Fimbriimonadaceae bacterium]
MTTRLLAEGHAAPPLPVMGNAALWIGALLVAFIWAFLVVAQKGYSVRGPESTVAKLAEHSYFFLEKVCVSVIGPHGRQFMPFMAAIWTVVFCGNVLGLVIHVTPTANLSFNLGMSLLTVAYVQVVGIKQNGLAGHLKHFAGPKMVGALALINVLIFLVEIMSESAKIVSLSLRLFGNIAGGGVVVKNLDELSVVIGQQMLHIDGFHIEVPIGSLLLPIKLLTAVLQPFVWIMLTAVYLNNVTHADHGDDHGVAHAH